MPAHRAMSSSDTSPISRSTSSRAAASSSRRLRSSPRRCVCGARLRDPPDSPDSALLDSLDRTILPRFVLARCLTPAGLRRYILQNSNKFEFLFSTRPAGDRLPVDAVTRIDADAVWLRVLARVRTCALAQSAQSVRRRTPTGRAAAGKGRFGLCSVTACRHRATWGQRAGHRRTSGVVRRGSRECAPRRGVARKTHAVSRCAHGADARVPGGRRRRRRHLATLKRPRPGRSTATRLRARRSTRLARMSAIWAGSHAGAAAALQRRLVPAASARQRPAARRGGRRYVRRADARHGITLGDDTARRDVAYIATLKAPDCRAGPSCDRNRAAAGVAIAPRRSSRASGLSHDCPRGFERLTDGTCELRSLCDLYASQDGPAGCAIAAHARATRRPRSILAGTCFRSRAVERHTVACADCHNPSLGFSDGRARSLGFDPSAAGSASARRPLERSAPSLWNVGFCQPVLDGRADRWRSRLTDRCSPPTRWPTR